MSFDFDDEILNFSNTFLGYGNFKSDLWFIGKEEGGGNTKEEIERRLKAWIKFGRSEICDVALFHNEIGCTELFSEHPSTQDTWRGLIRFQLSITNKQTTLEDVRIFQRDHFGRSDSNNLLMELLPLPSSHSSKWLYNEFSKLTILKDRKTYQNYFLDQRIMKIKEKILLNSPKIVVFYGFKKYKEELLKYLNIEMEHDLDIDFYFSSLGKTKLLFTDHPTYQNLPPKYYERVAETLKTKA